MRITTESLIDERPCRRCVWQRDCPPCAGDGDDSLGNLPDYMASCYYVDSESGFVTADEVDGVFMRRVIQFFFQAAAGEVHSLLVPCWDAIGNVIFVAGDPFSIDNIDFPGRDRPGWYRDDPNRIARECESLIYTPIEHGESSASSATSAPPDDPSEVGPI